VAAFCPALPWVKFTTEDLAPFPGSLLQANNEMWRAWYIWSCRKHHS